MHLELGFLDSMVNAFAMPLSYTNYPRQWLLQIAENLHSLVVIGLGFGALATYLRRRIEAFQDVAGVIWSKLDSETVRSRMAYAAQKGTPSNTADGAR